MPEIVACPECGRKLKVPDNFLGKKVKCPQCNAMFKAEAEEAGGGRDRDRDDDRRSSRDRDDDRVSSRRSRDDDDDDDRDRGRGGRRGRDDDDDRVSERASRRARDDDDDDRGRGRGRSRDDDYDDRDDDDDDRGRGRGRGRGLSPRQEKAGWQSVMLGLLLICVSIWIVLGSIAIYWLGWGAAWLLARSGSTMALSLLQGLVWVELLLILAAMAANLTGHGFNLLVPPRPPYGTKGLAIGTFATTAAAWVPLGILLVFSFSVVTASLLGGGFGGGFGGGGPVVRPGNRDEAEALGFLVVGLGCLTFVAGVASFFLCCFFLRSVSERVKRPDLASTTIVYMISHASFIVGVFLLAFLMAALIRATVRDMDTLIMAGYCRMVYYVIVYLIQAGLLVWFLIIVFQIRGAIWTYIRKKL